jgi:hypothetical protein
VKETIVLGNRTIISKTKTGKMKPALKTWRVTLLESKCSNGNLSFDSEA